MDIITFFAFYLNPFLQQNNQPAANRYFFNNFSYNYIALYNLGGITMHRAIRNIGNNRIDAMLRKPNCPFVLFVVKKKLAKPKEFEEYISKSLYI